MDAEIIDTLEVCFDDLDELQVELGMTDRLPEQTKSVTLTKNGNYSVMPDKDKVLTQVDVVANVLPTAETLYATENGIYTPQNADCFDKVVVDVSFPLQDYLDNGGKFGYSTWVEFPYESQEITLPKNVYALFADCTSLQTLDLSEWNTSNVTNMQQIFYNCTSLQTLDMSGWDTSNVTNMQSMFYNCTSLQTVDVSGWDTSKVTNMSYIFEMAYKANIKASGWNCESVTEIRAPLYWKYGIVDFSGWYNCHNFYTVSGWELNNVSSYIGTHTLADVEAGLTCFNGMGYKAVPSFVGYTDCLRYSSILAILNGLYDRTGMAALTFSLRKSTYNKCRNDDDTTPDADTIAERQAKISAICAAKNYTLSLS